MFKWQQLNLKKKGIKMKEVLGKIAYEAYCKYSDNKSLVTLCKLPKWDELDNRIKEAWEAAAKAVKLEVLK